MLKEQMNKIKDMFNVNNGNNKKKTENLVVFVIILIVTIIVINTILKDEDKSSKIQNTVTTKTLAKEDDEKKEEQQEELKEQLESILSKIEGVGETKVLITYSQTSRIIPIYNEDTSQSSTEESDSRWWK